MMRAKLMGVLDGLKQPYDLTSGLTFSNSEDKREAYDQGVNIGQAVAQAYRRVKDSVYVIHKGGRIEPAVWP